MKIYLQKPNPNPASCIRALIPNPCFRWVQWKGINFATGSCSLQWALLSSLKKRSNTEKVQLIKHLLECEPANNTLNHTRATTPTNHNYCATSVAMSNVPNCINLCFAQDIVGCAQLAALQHLQNRKILETFHNLLVTFRILCFSLLHTSTSLFPHYPTSTQEKDVKNRSRSLPPLDAPTSVVTEDLLVLVFTLSSDSHPLPTANYLSRITYNPPWMYTT